MTKIYNRKPTKEEKEKYLLLDAVNYNAMIYGGYTGELPLAEFRFISKDDIEVLMAFQEKDILTLSRLMREAKENKSQNIDKFEKLYGE